VASPDKKAFLLRLDPEVWAELESLAAQELRSVNGQIEYLLREALAARGRAPQSREGATRAKRKWSIERLANSAAGRSFPR
jgi:hypothetical protein